MVDCITMRRLLAWRKGDLTIRRYDCCEISLEVFKIIEGTRHADHPRRPGGTRNLYVFALNGAALAIDKGGQGMREIRGRWTLDVLPDGTLAVTDLAQTPMDIDIRDEKAKLAKMRKELESDDPARQYAALREFREKRCFALVPAVIALTDSKAQVTVPDGMHVTTAEGPHLTLPVQSTLGEEARSALHRVTHALRDRSSPTTKDGRRRWQTWWTGLLKTEPFPEVDVAPGTLTTIAELPMHWPELHISPDGAKGVLAYRDTHRAMDELPNGIRWMSFAETNASSFLYDCPRDDINRKPTGSVVAWTDQGVGIAWHEYEWDEKRHKAHFLAASPEGRVTHGPVPVSLTEARHLTLCRSVDSWLVVYNTKDGAVLSQRLDSVGSPLAKPIEVLKAGSIDLDYSIDARAASVVAAPSGAAAVFGGDDQVTLLMLDQAGRLRQSIRVDDPAIRGHGFKPQIERVGDSLCVAWVQSDNDDDRLMTRVFDVEGRPRTGVIVVAEFVSGMARPVAASDGFALVWRSYAQTPGQVRAAHLECDGKIGRKAVVYDGQITSPNVTAGLGDGQLSILVHDWTRWPFAVRWKQVKWPSPVSTARD